MAQKKQTDAVERLALRRNKKVYRTRTTIRRDR